MSRSVVQTLSGCGFVSAMVFQSPPALEDGRYTAKQVMVGFIWLFQSSPAPKDGRYIPVSTCSMP